MPTIGGLFNLLGVFGPLGPKVGGVVCQFMFTLVLYISCQQLGVMYNLLGVFGPGGYMPLCVNIGNVYHANNWGGNLLGVFGPFGPKVRWLCNLNWDLS